MILYLLFLVPSFSEAKIISSLCRINHPSDIHAEWECRKLKKGETLENIFKDRWIDIVRFNRVDRRHVYPGISIKVPKRLEDIKDFTPMPRYYQPAESEPKFILVNLSEQFLGAYEYGQLVFLLLLQQERTGMRRPMENSELTPMTADTNLHCTSLRKHAFSTQCITD